MLKHILLFVVILLFFNSCKKNENDVDFGFDYFPMEEGYFVEYEVISITHNPQSDTIKYRLKTVIGDTITDNSGRIGRKFYRYIYDTINNQYKVKDLWTALIDDYRAELVEENQRTIKMVFAPTLDKEWDINAFNENKPLYAFYENLEKEHTVNGLRFENTVKVVHEYEEPNFIEYKNKYEIYAKGFGLIELNYIEIEYQTGDINKPTDGYEIYYKITNYGRE